MQPLYKRISALSDKIRDALIRLNVQEKQAKFADLETQLSAPEVWNNPDAAQSLSKQAAALHAAITPWTTLEAQTNDIAELMEIGDESLVAEFDGQIQALEDEYERRSKDLYFDGPFDDHDVILRLSAGVGGLDAQDFTQMLERMYLRFFDQRGFTARSVERSTSDEAGVKTSVIEVSGPYAYGTLKSEHGVHRLVRLSPFNSDNLRQTSFALVEVLPQIDVPEEVALEDKDLKIDVYRAGGHGGQSVNTTDSAVRITHIPTGIVVAIQNERSQLQNKETVLKILRSKLAQLQLEQHAENTQDLQAGKSADWGSQIRNYVLHPYTLVKDTRTKHEDRDATGVLDGKLDGFIDAYLASL